jgi:hypothetical protein
MWILKCTKSRLLLSVLRWRHINQGLQPSRSSIALPVLGFAGAGLLAAFAPYKPAWLFCLAISAIVIPFAGPAFFFIPDPANKPAKASPPAAFFAGCAPIFGDANEEPGVVTAGDAEGPV